MKKKYKCVNTYGYPNLKLNKVYECERETPHYIYVLNELGDVQGFGRHRFEEVTETIMKKKYKCINSAAVSCLKEGNMYESEWEDNDYFYINIEGTLTAFSKNRFVEVEVEPNVLENIRKELEEARKLVGKTVTFNDSLKYDVGEVGLHIYKEPTEKISLYVQGEAKRKGYCVYVKSMHGTYANPYKTVEVVQDFVDIVLNDQYSAKVYKDKVIVGCQTFTMDKVKEILDAGNKLK